MSTEMLTSPNAPAEAPEIRPATLQEYFELDRKSELRNEYVDGRILAMAGGTPAHNRISKNICVQLENAFGDRSCDAFIADIRTRVSKTRYRYPDIVALCGEAQFDQERPPSLLNPSVIFEVLSPSTEEIDHGKFDEYRQLETLTDYLLVAQDRVEVAHYARQSALQWTVRIYVEITNRIALTSLDVMLTVGDIYRKVVFEPAP